MLKRNMAVSLLAASLFVVGLPQAGAAGGQAPLLSDVAGHWAEADIRAAVDAGWVNGYPDGSFRPEAEVTRAEFLKMAGLLPPVQGVDQERRIRLYDRVAEQSHWLVQLGYLKSALGAGLWEPADYALAYGESGGVTRVTLEPEKPLTRTEAAVILARAAGRKFQAEAPWLYPGSRYAAKVPMPSLPFTDAFGTPDWAKGWVAEAAGAGLVQGYPDGSFGGRGKIKRAEAVVMLRRAAAVEAASLDLLSRLRAPETAELEAMDGLSVRDFVAVRNLFYEPHAGATRAEAEQTWASLSRADREALVRRETEAFWAEVRDRDFGPLLLRGVMVNVTGPQYMQAAEGHLLAGQFTYLDVNGMADPADPTSGAQLVRLPDDLETQVARYMERARVTLQGAGPVMPRRVFTFPYQYLGEWFAVSPEQATRWAETQARTYFATIQPVVEALGGSLGGVTIQVSPSDTADRGGQYQSLLYGHTLLANPVLNLSYDGTAFTVSQAGSLSNWLDAAQPQYEWERQGEGWGAPRVDPDIAIARRLLATFVETLGGRP